MTHTHTADPQPIIECKGLGKRFTASKYVLEDVDLTIERGTVHALVGENGAGKSTLGKIVAGVHRHDRGTLRIDGREVNYGAPREALADGVAIIAQELSLVPELTVAENVFLGNESRRYGLLDPRGLARRYAELVERTGFALAGDVLVGRLSIADQQKAEILRALARDARVIVMDEPTAALSRPEAELLLHDIRELRAKGTTIIYVSHFLEEMLSVADAITVLRDGELVATVAPADVTIPDIVRMMLGGRNLADRGASGPARPVGDVVLRTHELAVPGAFEDVSLELRAGEIVGLAGLVGSGRSEIAHALFGSVPAKSGTIEVDGREVRIRSPREAIAHGIALLPESRKTQGLVLGESVADNMSLAALPRLSRFGLRRLAAERRATGEMSERVGVRGADTTAISRLSGGNQQKALLGKWLLTEPRVLIADEPTRGVDIGAKDAIYDVLRDLAASGLAILVISSELEEIVALADRVVVMRNGRPTAEFRAEQVTSNSIMSAAFESSPETPEADLEGARQ